MSVRMYDSGNLLSDGVDQYAIIHMTADTASDLVGLQTYDTVKLLQGSTIIDISTGDKYMMKSDYTWILQPNASQSVSIDIPDFDALENRIDDLEDDVSDIQTDVSTLSTSDTKQNAALLKLINTGGKNFSTVNTASGTLRLIIDVDAPAGDYILSIGDLTSNDTDTSVCLITIYDANGGTLYTGGSTRGTDKQISVSLADTAKKIYIYASDNYSHSSGDTVSITDLMLCAKADWDMTQTYEPYCPTLDQLYAIVSDEISGLNALIGGGIT